MMKKSPNLLKLALIVMLSLLIMTVFKSCMASIDEVSKENAALKVCKYINQHPDTQKGRGCVSARWNGNVNDVDTIIISTPTGKELWSYIKYPSNSGIATFYLNDVE